MNKHIKRAICGVIVAVLIMSTASMLFACDKEQSYDPETRPVTFSISALDGTFNPFFTTSATDSTIAGFTQVAMFATSNEGEIECGENVPTVVLDYSITSYDENNNVVSGGNDVDHTTYEFVIKNGIKYSDGVPLAIDDVLFNLYVYLDPMYSGSSTIYSTDIKGLTAYRYNDPTLADDADVDDSVYRAAAEQRMYNLLDWADGERELDDEMQKDIESIKAQLLKDLTADWTSNFGTLETDYKEYSFTEDWQSYYLIEGLISIKTDINTAGHTYQVKDSNGKYVTDLNVKDSAGNWIVDTNHETHHAQEMHNAITNEATIAQYMSDNKCDRNAAIELIMKDTAIQTAYNNYCGDLNAIKNNIITIFYGMSSGSQILDKWTLEEQSKAYEGTSGADVKSISGITTKKVSSFNGINKTQLTEEHDVLCITINGIDPKAIWNFAFAVAPMHYYSDAETLADKVNYPYGVRARNLEFFNNVLNSPEKSALPVGAGAYRASNEAGNASADPAKVNSKEFWTNKKVYFERNDYFYTLGSGLYNAKIRRLIYEEISENNILNSLKTGRIDYGTPSATPYNKQEVAADGKLGSIEYKTSGYGYIGINPKYVADLEVRQAIMMAFDTSSIIGTYYGGTMAENIYRPMSKLSWAYPTGCTPYYQYDSTGLKIEELVESAGYTKGNDGVYVKNGKRLKFKFTIAGDTTDHPAAQMFEKARDILNDHGFEITVGTDVQALKKLSNGGLEVWAAAWTSTIDPDMYQIYHKDSKTTNVKNWYYEGILNTDLYPREKEIVLELSDLIDQGRETNNKTERATIYSQALDKIMDLAVEFPTYQRKDLAVYNKDVIDATTLNRSDDLKYSGPTDRIWELNYN